MRLPSFEEQDKNRSYNMDYAGHAKQIRPRSRYGNQMAELEVDWKDDAFFGWLPGRGPPPNAELHRPLEAARMKRLPSFTENAQGKFLGLRGKGLGVLKVNV